MPQTRIDILVNGDRSPVIVNGDFVLGTSDEQHVKDLVEFKKSDIPQFPIVGANIDYFIQATNRQKMIRDITEALKTDGYKFIGFKNDANGSNLLFT